MTGAFPESGMDIPSRAFYAGAFFFRAGPRALRHQSSVAVDGGAGHERRPFAREKEDETRDVGREADPPERVGPRHGGPGAGRLLGVHFCELAPSHGGIDGARIHGEHPDVVRRVLQRELPGQREDSSLARGIGRHPLHRLPPLDARDVDDDSGTTAAELGHAVLRHQEAARQIDREDAVPHFFGHFVGGRVAFLGLNTGVVAQHVDPPEQADRLAPRRLAFGAHRHVNAEKRDAPGAPGKVVARSFVDVEAQHFRAVRGKRLADPPADSLRASRDHDSLARQVSHFPLTPRCLNRPSV